MIDEALHVCIIGCVLGCVNIIGCVCVRIVSDMRALIYACLSSACALLYLAVITRNWAELDPNWVISRYVSVGWCLASEQLSELCK